MGSSGPSTDELVDKLLSLCRPLKGGPAAGRTKSEIEDVVNELTDLGPGAPARSRDYNGSFEVLHCSDPSIFGDAAGGLVLGAKRFQVVQRPDKLAFITEYKLGGLLESYIKQLYRFSVNGGREVQAAGVSIVKKELGGPRTRDSSEESESVVLYCDSRVKVEVRLPMEALLVMERTEDLAALAFGDAAPGTTIVKRQARAPPPAPKPKRPASPRGAKAPPKKAAKEEAGELPGLPALPPLPALPFLGGGAPAEGAATKAERQASMGRSRPQAKGARPPKAAPRDTEREKKAAAKAAAREQVADFKAQAEAAKQALRQLSDELKAARKEAAAARKEAEAAAGEQGSLEAELTAVKAKLEGAAAEEKKSQSQAREAEKSIRALG